MKSLSIKVPIKIAQLMDDRGELSPKWISGFLIVNMNNTPPEKPLQGLSVNYTCKVDDLLHKHVKLKAIDHDLPLNEFVGRLLEKYYK